MVVVNRQALAADVVPAAEALARELHSDEDQIVWVDRAGVGWPHAGPAADLVTAPRRASRGECYGLGLALVRNPLVAFTDSQTVVDHGWRRAVARSFEPPEVAVVGGPVRPSPVRSSASWAGFLVDYGPHAVAPFTSATGDVSGNNVVYRRCVLPSLDGPVWKTDVNARLRACGTPPVLTPDMGATSWRQYSWRDLLQARARSGVSYGAQRSRGWSPVVRVTAAAACVGLPALAFGRLRARLQGDDELYRQLLRNWPGVTVALVAWSAGEAVGYLWSRSEGSGVW